MTKSYSEELLQRRKTKTKLKSKNLNDFLLCVHDIKECLDKKIPMNFIWNDLQEIGRINFGYTQFTSYVKKYITETDKPQATLMKNESTDSKKAKNVLAKYEEPVNPLIKNLQEK